MDKYAELKQELGKHSLRDYPREAGGLILKDFSYVPCLNLSSEPTLSFILDPGALIQYDEQIWGIFHSHPGDDNPIPSKEDKIGAAFQEYKFLVGFGEKFFIYWYDNKVNALKFDRFEEKHLEG